MTRPVIDDSFAPPDGEPEPLGPRSGARKQRGAGCLKGCLIALAIGALAAVLAVYACGRAIERALVEDPAEVQRIAATIAHFRLPEHFEPEGAMQLPVLGEVAFFARAQPGVDGGDSDDGRAMLVLARVAVAMDEKDLLEGVGQASGQSSASQQLQLHSRPCQVAGRQALCVDAETESSERDLVARWQAVVVPVGRGSVAAAVIDRKDHFDPALAQAFLDSIEPLD